PGHGATGAAYVFERSGGTWGEVLALGVPAGSSDDGFGADVDLDGDTAVVGAQTGNEVGAAYVFVHGAPGWTLQQRIQPDGLTTFARFGSSVDLAGDQLVVGAPGDGATGFGLGSSWAFGRAGGVWSARARLAQSPGAPAGLFGTSVATDGAGTVFTAAPRNVTPSAGNYGALFVHTPEPEIGDAYCAANANSSGQVGGAAARGSRIASANDVTLVAFDLPAQQFGFFLASRTEGFVANLGGSEGNLCLGGALGRLVGPGQIQSSGTARQISIDLDLTAIPQPSSLETAVAGETWRFQAWHRDTVGGTATSNFTAGVAVSFL
ncbi:MAG: FG-GAP repeat protein, partial [Planctomycetota bacterium]